MKRTFWMTSLAGLIAVLAIIAVGGGAQTQVSAATPLEDPPAAAVKIDNFSFTPNQLTVAVGATISWTNHDDVPHNVVAEDKSFKSKTLDTDDVFVYTFTKPGTYKYFCGLHPKMTATVVVK